MTFPSFPSKAAAYSMIWLKNALRMGTRVYPLTFVFWLTFTAGQKYIPFCLMYCLYSFF